MIVVFFVVFVVFWCEVFNNVPYRVGCVLRLNSVGFLQGSKMCLLFILPAAIYYNSLQGLIAGFNLQNSFKEMHFSFSIFFAFLALPYKFCVYEGF